MKSLQPTLAAMRAAPIVPVLTVPDAAASEDLAAAFVRAGLTTVEVTLRTDAGLEAITRMKAAQPSLIVGAGTVLNAEDLDAAMKAGSDFLVSPGLSPDLSDAIRANDAPMIPGVATPSEAMARREEGITMLKLFPAEVVGGAAMIKAICAPIPDLQFMPTGGVNLQNAPDYLAIPNVVAVGGTWIAKADDISAGHFDKIEATAAQAMAALAPRPA